MILKMDSAHPVDHPPYHERYCAFVDILGFGELIERLNHGQTAFESLRDLLDQVHNPEKGTDKSWYTEFRAQSISDAVAISTVRNPVGLVELLNATEDLSLELLNQGFFVRGAIVKGMLYHDESMVFGEALVRAYRLEREVVRFPRIMLTRDVVEDLKGYCDQNQLGSEVLPRVRRAEDGPWHIHILRDLELLQEKPAVVRRHRPGGFFARIQGQIQKRLDQAVDNPRHFEKVRWFADYWNRINLPLTGGLTQVVWPGLRLVQF
jgi:hypothetical protein